MARIWLTEGRAHVHKHPSFSDVRVRGGERDRQKVRPRSVGQVRLATSSGEGRDGRPVPSGRRREAILGMETVKLKWCS